MLDSELYKAVIARTKKIPIVETLQFDIVSLEEGYCEMSVPRKLKYNGVFESFHGVILMTIADSAACFAILTKTDPDIQLTTTDMNIRFLAPCLTDVTAKAKLIKQGRTLCPVAVDLFDQENTHIAVAQVNYILLTQTN